MTFSKKPTSSKSEKVKVNSNRVEKYSHTKQRKASFSFINSTREILVNYSWGLFPLLWITLFTVYPFIAIVSNGIDEGFGETFSTLNELISSSLFLKIVRFTFLQAFLSMLATLVLGIPLGLIFARYTFYGKTFLRSLFTLPFVLPPVYVVLGFTLFFDTYGWFGDFINTVFHVRPPLDYFSRGLSGIITAHMFYNIPIVMNFVASDVQKIPQTIEESAKTLGSTRMHYYRKVVFPLITPAIITSGLLAFSYSFLSYAIILGLGHFKHFTLETQIQFYYDNNLSTWASLTALIQFVQIVIILIVGSIAISKLKSKLAISDTKGETVHPKKLSLNEKKSYVIFSFLTLIAILDVGPMIAVVLRSLTSPEGTISIAAYQEIFSSTIDERLGIVPYYTLINTLYMAIASTLLTFIITLVALLLSGQLTKRKQSIYQSYLLLPITMSSITLGLGMLLAFNKTNWFNTNTWLVLIFTYSTISLPFMLRAFDNALQAIDPEVVEASRMLGRGHLDTFLTVQLPLIKNGLIVGIAFSMAITFGEFAATNFLYQTKGMTVSVAIWKYYGVKQFEKAAALSSILGLLSLVCFWLISKYEKNTLR
ncbi:MAG: ABC transporter permease [Candidatus Kariarchaeaceae archaeon]